MGTDSLCGDPEGMGEKGTHGEGMCDPEIVDKDTSLSTCVASGKFLDLSTSISSPAKWR